MLTTEQEVKTSGPNLDMRFCLQPSDTYMQMLDKCDGDPRLVSATMALRKAGPLAIKSWQADWEARDTRKNIIG